MGAVKPYKSTISHRDHPHLRRMLMPARTIAIPATSRNGAYPFSQRSAVESVSSLIRMPLTGTIVVNTMTTPVKKLATQDIRKIQGMFSRCRTIVPILIRSDARYPSTHEGRLNGFLKLTSPSRLSTLVDDYRSRVGQRSPSGSADGPNTK